jgi:hypothetical protein
MTDTTTGLTISEFQPSSNRNLSVALVGLRQAIRDAAQQNVDAVTAQDDSYSVSEKRAMLVIDELKQVNGLDLAAILMRAELLKTIQRENLITLHPARYDSLQHMASEQGISLTELSQTLDLTNIIFPYLQDHVGANIAEMWEAMGKSNFKELVPVLKSIITNSPSDTQSVNIAVARLMDDAAATALAAGQEFGDEELRETVVDQLVHDGIHLTNRELRERIRPERTPVINLGVIPQNGSRFVLAKVTAEQYALMVRLLGARVDPMTYDLPTDPHARQVESARVPEIRELMSYVRGEE